MRSRRPNEWTALLAGGIALIALSLGGCSAKEAEEAPSASAAPQAPAASLSESGREGAGAPPTASVPEDAATPAGRASLRGRVRYEGPPLKKPDAIKMNADPKCVAMHADAPVFPDHEIVGAGGELANAFVYVSGGVPAGDHPVPSAPAVLDQKGCIYAPHVQGVRVNQTIAIVNSDNTMHNVRCFARRNPPFNLGQPAPGTREKSFKRAEEAVKFKCDIHPWMTAYMFVMEHPFFAVTGETGEFTIEGLPPGKYSVTAWHETLGELEAEVAVGTEGGEAEFTFRAK